MQNYLREKYGSPTQLLARKYERDLHRKTRYTNHHIFSLRCRDEKVIPVSLRIRPPLETKRAFKIAERASRAFLNERIKETQRKRNEVMSRIAATQRRLEHELTTDDFERVSKLCKDAAERTFVRTKRDHLRKLEGLTRKKGPVNLKPEGLDRWLVNRTSVTLTKPQNDVLRLGLNFALAPNRVPVKDFIAAVETATTKLDEDAADDLRMRVCGVIRKARPPAPNLSRQQRIALKELKQLENVVILPADKGNATVLMTREEYNSKMEELLSTDTYRMLKKDPTAAQEAKIGRVLRDYVKKNEVNDELYNWLRPSGCQPPRIYGLPKIHKEGVPLRPIVSCINSPSYRLSKHIAQLISPLTGSTDSFVRNSRHFVEVMAGVKLSPDELLVSFDVSSLFTNVPIQEAVDVICKRLQDDETLNERTALQPNSIAGLLQLCLQSTYFCFNGKVYEQREGAAMGSPVSAVVANLYMEHVEQLALECAPSRPRLWKRCVDDAA